MRDLILGVDPGLDGALALIDLHNGDLVDVFDMPVLQLKAKRELDEYGLARIIDQHAALLTDAWIERVWSMPGEGVVQAFAFGAAYGQLRGVICANFIPLHDVVPTVWKRAVGVAGDKDESRKAASIQWPDQTGRWPAKKHHGRADASLIAAYGRRQFLKVHDVTEAA